MAQRKGMRIGEQRKRQRYRLRRARSQVEEDEAAAEANMIGGAGGKREGEMLAVG